MILTVHYFATVNYYCLLARNKLILLIALNYNSWWLSNRILYIRNKSVVTLSHKSLSIFLIKRDLRNWLQRLEIYANLCKQTRIMLLLEYAGSIILTHSAVHVLWWINQTIMRAYGWAETWSRGLILTLLATKGRIIVEVNSCLCHTPQSTLRQTIATSIPLSPSALWTISK